MTGAYAYAHAYRVALGVHRFRTCIPVDNTRCIQTKAHESSEVERYTVCIRVLHRCESTRYYTKPVVYPMMYTCMIDTRSRAHRESRPTIQAVALASCRWPRCRRAYFILLRSILSADLLVDIHPQTTIIMAKQGQLLIKRCIANAAPVYDTHAKVRKSHHSECKASTRHVAPSDVLT